jgi:hypothetical protein
MRPKVRVHLNFECICMIYQTYLLPARRAPAPLVPFSAVEPCCPGLPTGRTWP